MMIYAPGWRITKVQTVEVGGNKCHIIKCERATLLCKEGRKISSRVHCVRNSFEENREALW